jgi:hypothetical protein
VALHGAKLPVDSCRHSSHWRLCWWHPTGLPSIGSHALPETTLSNLCVWEWGRWSTRWPSQPPTRWWPPNRYDATNAESAIATSLNHVVEWAICWTWFPLLGASTVALIPLFRTETPSLAQEQGRVERWKMNSKVRCREILAALSSFVTELLAPLLFPWTHTLSEQHATHKFLYTLCSNHSLHYLATWAWSACSTGPWRAPDA